MKIRFWVKEVRIEISFWFFAALSFFFALDTGALRYYFLIPVAVHELGHLLALWVCGVKIRAVEFTAFGIEIEKARRFASYPKELLIAASGILANGAAALWMFLFAFPSMRTQLLIAANLAVGGFNLLPIGNLDGGCIARLLSERFFSQRTAFLLSRIFSFIALIPLFALSFFLLLRPERNFTLLAVTVYLAAEIIRKN